MSVKRARLRIPRAAGVDSVLTAACGLVRMAGLGRPLVADGKAFSRVCAGDAAVWVSPDCAISLSASRVSQLDLCASEHVAVRELDGPDGHAIAAENPPSKAICLPVPICLVKSTLDLLGLAWAECLGDPGI
jgi:hypothetical protein